MNWTNFTPAVIDRGFCKCVTEGKAIELCQQLKVGIAYEFMYCFFIGFLFYLVPSYVDKMELKKETKNRIRRGCNFVFMFLMIVGLVWGKSLEMGWI